MTCGYKEDADLKTIEITIDGKVTKDDLTEMFPKIDAFIQANGTIKMIEIVKNFGGFELSALGEGIKFDRKHIKYFSHCAVVSDHGWVGPLSRMVSSVLSVEIKTFKLNEEQDARNWLQNTEAPVA